MTTQSLRLNYPPTLLRRPIIHQLIREFEIAVNIVQARITLEEGWLEIEISGEEHVIDDALTWLKEQGIEVTGLDNQD
jgi:ABC-type methionine transport system ATPase subunit